MRRIRTKYIRIAQNWECSRTFDCGKVDMLCIASPIVELVAPIYVLQTDKSKTKFKRKEREIERKKKRNNN